MKSATMSSENFINKIKEAIKAESIKRIATGAIFAISFIIGGFTTYVVGLSDLAATVLPRVSANTESVELLDRGLAALNAKVDNLSIENQIVLAKLDVLLQIIQNANQ